jgi:hypothetical protein
MELMLVISRAVVLSAGVLFYVGSEGTHVPEDIELYPAMSWDDGKAAEFPHHGYDKLFAGQKVKRTVEVLSEEPIL